MARLGAGFTIIEVVIVLAITGLLFLSAVTMFAGKRSQTEFVQAMYDLESQIQSVLSATKSGTFQDSEKYICVVRNNNIQPAVREPLPADPPLSEPGTRSNCLTLGRAVQARPNDGNLYIFTVIGLAKDSATGKPVASLKEAGPSVIAGTHSSSTADLTVIYKLISGVRVLSATIPGNSNRYDIAGFYLAPQGGSSAGQGSTFTSLAYPFESSSTDNYEEDNDEARRIEECVLQDSALCENSITLGRWELCLQGQNGQDRAVLSLIGVPGGVNTDLEFKDCS